MALILFALPVGRARASDGTPVEVTGKYRELVGHELRLADDPRLFLLKSDALLDRVLELVSDGDNLRISGRLLEGSDPPSVEVESVELAPSDAEIFQDRLKAIESSDPEERAAKLEALAGEAIQNYARYRNKEVFAIAENLVFSIAKSARRESPDDLARCLRLFRAFRSVASDASLCFNLLLEVDKTYPRNAQVAECFRELRCRRHSGRWVQYEEFKKLEGFVLYEGRWMKPYERHMIETIKAFDRSGPTNLILRHRTEREYKLLSERGSVELGMRPEEVLRALGPPDRVERRLYEGGEFDQWIYGDKYYYFYGGLLVRKP